MSYKTATQLKVLTEPFEKHLTILYDRLVAQCHTSNIFSEDDTNKDYVAFCDTVKTKLSSKQQYVDEFDSAYKTFSEIFYNINGFLVSLASHGPTQSNIAMIKALNGTFQFYQHDIDINAGKPAEYRLYLVKWLIALGVLNLGTFAGTQAGKLTNDVISTRVIEELIKPDVRNRIGGKLCRSFFECKRVTQLKEERHELMKQIFFELGLFVVKPGTKKSELVFAQMVAASMPKDKWKAAVTAYSTPVYQACSSHEANFPHGAVREEVKTSTDGYVVNPDAMFERCNFKTIIALFKEHGYTAYATFKHEYYVITMKDVQHMREYAESIGLTLSITYGKESTENKEVFLRIANVFNQYRQDYAKMPLEELAKVKLEILANWLTVNQISSFVRENTSNDGMTLFDKLNKEWLKTMGADPSKPAEKLPFPKTISECCDRNLDKTQGTRICWICGCPIEEALSAACDHFHAMMAMSILININDPESVLCDNFGYTHPRCNGLKSKYPVSMIYGLLGSTYFRNASGASGASSTDCYDPVEFKRMYFKNLCNLKGKGIKERLDFYLSALLVKLTVPAFNRKVVRLLYTTTSLNNMGEAANLFTERLQSITNMITDESTTGASQTSVPVPSSGTIGDETMMSIDTPFTTGASEPDTVITLVPEVTKQDAFEELVSVADTLDPTTRDDINEVSAALATGATDSILKAEAGRVRATFNIVATGVFSRDEVIDNLRESLALARALPPAPARSASNPITIAEKLAITSGSQETKLAELEKTVRILQEQVQSEQSKALEQLTALEEQLQQQQQLQQQLESERSKAFEKLIQLELENSIALEEKQKELEFEKSRASEASEALEALKTKQEKLEQQQELEQQQQQKLQQERKLKKSRTRDDFQDEEDKTTVKGKFGGAIMDYNINANAKLHTKKKKLGSNKTKKSKNKKPKHKKPKKPKKHKTKNAKNYKSFFNKTLKKY